MRVVGNLSASTLPGDAMLLAAPLLAAALLLPSGLSPARPSLTHGRNVARVSAAGMVEEYSGTPLEQAQAAAAAERAAAGENPPSTSDKYKAEGGGFVGYANVRDEMMAAFEAADTDGDTFVVESELEAIL